MLSSGGDGGGGGDDKLSMDRVAVYGWCRRPWMESPLLGNSGDEMYGGSDGVCFRPWIDLPSMDGRPLSMDGRIHQSNATQARF